MDQTIQERREQGLEAALALVRSGRGKALMDQIRAEVASVAAREQQELEDAAKRSDRAHLVRTVIFVVVGVLNNGQIDFPGPRA